jgi:hypothetical protein
MRTKTLLLSALLGALGSVAVNAQTNVYSLNAVGYVNVVCPVGYTLISCPLIASPDNTIGTLLNNASGTYTGDSVFTYNTSTGQFVLDEAEAIGTRGGTTNANGWAFNGTNTLAPGVGAWFYNAGSNSVTLTFVGTVPSGTLTNTLTPGYNLVGSILPTSGDLASNTLTSLTNYNIGDSVFAYANPGGFTIYQSGTNRGQGGFGYQEAGTSIPNWSSTGDPTAAYVGEGFWYFNSGATVNWVENYSVSE